MSRYFDEPGESSTTKLTSTPTRPWGYFNAENGEDGGDQEGAVEAEGEPEEAEELTEGDIEGSEGESEGEEEEFSGEEAED